MKTILAWHWSNGLKCQFDNRPIVPGETLVYDGKEPIRLCERGLHASAKILDSLLYAPGTTISRVRLSGEIVRGSDKIVATHRETIWSFDATYILITFAADCAERALLRERRAGREPDLTSFTAIEAARKLVKDPTEENRKAAKAASDATSAAPYAAHNAASAAGDAASAASDAASAANYAAWEANYAALAASDAALAAHYAASDVDANAWTREREWQSARLRNLIAAGRAAQSSPARLTLT